MGIVSPREMEKPEGNFRVALEEKSLVLRAKRVWCVPGTLGGRPVWRYGLQFTGIAADDWDALVRYCSGGAIAQENKAQKELQLIKLQPDDVARLIPERLQQRLLEMLVQRRRLAPLEPGRTPLVYYSYGGLRKRGANQMHHLSVHSRVNDLETGETATFDTVFYFDSTGEQVEIVDR